MSRQEKTKSGNFVSNAECFSLSYLYGVFAISSAQQF